MTSEELQLQNPGPFKAESMTLCNLLTTVFILYYQLRIRIHYKWLSMHSALSANYSDTYYRPLQLNICAWYLLRKEEGM